MNLDISVLSGAPIILIGIAFGVQAFLAVIGLVILVRTPAERVQFGRKWPWVLVILCINLIGPILFFALGRRPAPATDAATAPATGVASAVESLYGEGRA